MKGLQITIIILVTLFYIILGILAYIHNNIYNTNQEILMTEIHDIKTTLELREIVEEE